MLITDKNELCKFSTEYRLWQGIPGIEVTKNGRIFCSFFSGTTKEDIGNFSCIIMSDDGGKTFSEPIVVAYSEGHRCFDPSLWIDSLGRLWFVFAYAPDHCVKAYVCNNPDDQEIKWDFDLTFPGEVMLNKPTVLSSGEWLFPIAVWNKGVRVLEPKYDSVYTDRRAFVFKTSNNGQSFEKLGGSNIEGRAYDEHMVIERSDGTLAMYVRTLYGIGVSYSYDRGKTWTRGGNSGIPGPCSRFHIRKLKSGRWLLVNHHNFVGRNNLTAMLSEDEGKTWKYKLLLDERGCSYPDVKESDDGYLYIIYDHGRGAFLHSLDELYACTREILFAKITENDIIAGKLVSSESRLKCLVCELGKYKNEDENPYKEIKRYSEDELTDILLTKSNDELISVLFDNYSINCLNMHLIDSSELDSLIEELGENEKDRRNTIHKIISLIRAVSVFKPNDNKPIIDRIKDEIKNNLSDSISLNKIAYTVGISQCYMSHVFKKETGITVTEYRNALRLTNAKRLLVNTDMKVADIAYECGFGSESYFSKMFSESERLSPAQYRKILKR